MASITVSFKDFGRALNHAERIKGFVPKLKLAGMRANTSEELVKAVLTRTLQSSEAPFEGEPEGRGLDYQYGNTPLAASAVDEAVRASGAFGTVGWANDAVNKSGQPYGMYVKGYTDDHIRGFLRQSRAIKDAMPQAWEEAGREVER